MQRAPFNILYLGMNQAEPALDGLKVRQAIAHAIDKDAVISQSLPEGSELGHAVHPGRRRRLHRRRHEYEYDPEKAKALLAEAGASDLTLQFNYPTGVSRPYMPTPEETFVAIRSQLEAVGITVEPVADQWSPDYLDKIQGTRDHGIHLLGWTGDYNDTDNFVGVFFGGQSAEWGFDNPELVRRARPRPAASRPARSRSRRTRTINRRSWTSCRVSRWPTRCRRWPSPPDVEGYPPRPVQDEVWNAVTVERVSDR